MKAHASKIGKAMCAALFVLLLNVVGMTKANPVDMSTAREVAMKFMNANTNAPLRSIDDLHHVTTYNISRGDASFYIFNTPNGFVIVSADDCATPILGYSNEGQFDTENIPIQLQDYLQGFVNQIQYGIENQIEADERTARQWEMVRTIGRLTNNRTDEVVEPLLTTKWGQRYPYNMFVPSDCPTGCVATAMAQIMKYWEWPVQGVGEHSYLWNGQILSANFGETTYDWDNMLDDYDNNPGTQEQKEAVATLMWHCGVSVNMDYSPNGSGAGLNSGTLIDYFSYSDEMSLEYSWDYSTASWNARLKDCLNLGRPLYYMGHQYSGSGHAFVCDGYDINDMFHFNWGWDGGFDGYFSIGVLYVNTLNYNYENLAIFNIHPQGEATNYTINISVNNDEGGSASGGGSFAHGDHVTLTAIANDGYGFCYWEENGGIASTNPNYSFTANYNRDLVAKFAEPFVVTVMAEEGGTVSGGGSFLYGQSCSVSATANEGYGFANWTKNGVVASIDANYTFAVTDESLLIAHFVPLEGNIEFADDNVKAICLTNWDTNEDGELSYVEAAAVTSLGEVFRGNMEIISFDELQYFISLTSIGDYAFNGCGELTSMIIPDNVISIGNSAFNGCSGMTGSLTIPNSVTSIGYRAFRGCSGFTGSLTIPNSVTSIGGYAFSGCSGFTGVNYTGDIAQWCNITFGDLSANPLGYAHNLYLNEVLVTDLVIPETVTKIKDYTFYGCSGLTGNLTIPNSVTSIGNAAFSDCSGLTGNLTIPNSVTRIDDGAFYGCSGFTGSLTIPNSVTSIGGDAFSGCSSFTGSLTIPNSVTSIGSYAFYGCSGFTGSLTIPSSVTSIGSYAFYGCSGFTGSLTIPNSVTSIGGDAFSGCSSFTGSLTIPNSVTSIGSYAFYGCSGFTGVNYTGDIAQWCNIQFANYASNPLIYAHNLYIDNELVTELVIPETIMEIKDYVFHGATCLTSLTIPNSVTSIGSYAFGSCSGLTGSLIIPNTVTSIGSSAFSNCSGFTGSLTIPSTVASIGSSAFNNCSGFTGDLIIPNSVTSIGSNAFRGCSGFTGSLTIPNSVTLIGSYAFYNCRGFTGSLTIPNSVTSLDGSAFYNCYGLSSMVVLAEMPPAVGSDAFYNISTNIPVYVPCESLETYQTAEGWNAFTNIMCISSGTISVVADPFEGGEVSGAGTYEGGTFCTVTATPNEGYVFANWTKNGIIVSNSPSYSFVVTGESVLNARFVAGGNIDFADANVKAICVANWDTDGDGELSYVEAASVTSLVGVFSGNTEITSFEELQYFISLSTIGADFYNCSGLTGSLYIPNSVTSIGNSAFRGCSGLTGSLTLPNTLTTIGIFAFEGCSGLTGNLIIPNSVTSIGDCAFYNCSGLNGNLTISNSLTSIGSYVFYGCSGLTGSLNIPNSVTSIGNSAFRGCSGLTGDLIIPNSVTSIGDCAFYGCSGLNGNLTIFNSLTSIGSSVFYSCSGLTGNLIIPNSVTSIGDCAFYNCSGLNGNLTISNSLTSIGSSAFSNCSGFTGDLIIPNSVTSIGGYAFYGCSGLNGNLTISNSLTSIGSSVFDGCSGLTGSLNIPNSVTSIGNSAFRGCSGLTGDLIIPNSVTSIGSSAFWRCSGLTGELIIPNSVTSIGSFAFYYCRSLASVIMLSSTVPSLGNNAFSGTNANYYIYVPYPSLEAYKTATNWSNYEHRIFPMAYASVSGYGTGNGRWVFIASPFSDDVVPSAIDNMLLGTNYDLYQFDQSATDEEWQNYKDDSFNLVNGHGYMYANGVDVNVIFKGAFNEDETKVVSLDYDAEKTNPGWNLVGNPFPVDAYIDRPYYVMNEDGTAINPIAVPADTPIPPCVGVLVKANGTGESVTFSRSAPETRK